MQKVIDKCSDIMYICIIKRRENMNYMNYDFAPELRKADERKKARKRAIISCVGYGFAVVGLWSYMIVKFSELF